jgi:competence protein ComEA
VTDVTPNVSTAVQHTRVRLLWGRKREDSMDEIVVAGSWRDKVATLGGRRKDLAAVAAVVVAVVIGASLMRSGAEAAIAPPATSSSATATPPAGAIGNGLLVHIAGEVKRPGLYEFPDGARVADAIDTAGGPTRRADLNAINLAQPLTDGLKLDVPVWGSVPVPVATSAGLISLNSADQARLEEIPGIGPVRAAAILDYRDQIGGFSSLEELLEIQGIGPSTLEAMRDFITL